LSYDEASPSGDPVTLSLTGNQFTDNTAGSAATSGLGGALLVDGSAVLSDDGSTCTGNRALGSNAAGGAIYDAGNQSGPSARFTGTVFRGNSASGAGSYGGAVYADMAGDSYVGVTVSGNRADAGGGVFSYAARFVDSTVSGNTATSQSTIPGHGGGLYIEGVLSVTNSTIAGNKADSAGSAAGEGGGIVEVDGSVFAMYSTISSNSAGLGGGIYADGFGGGILASIVTGNGSHNCSAAATTDKLSSLGDSVLASGCVTSALPTDRTTSSAGLKPLANNAGPTETMALTSTSPAIDRGGFDCPSTDQRGEPRSATACDAGAYQAAAGWISKISPSKGVGGTAAVISGHGLVFADIVYFGSSKAKFRVVSDSEIVATAPGHSAGKVNVKVMTPDGFSDVAVFTYTDNANSVSSREPISQVRFRPRRSTCPWRWRREASCPWPRGRLRRRGSGPDVGQDAPDRDRHRHRGGLFGNFACDTSTGRRSPGALIRLFGSDGG
jgi:hypothetical protein